MPILTRLVTQYAKAVVEITIWRLAKATVDKLFSIEDKLANYRTPKFR